MKYESGLLDKNASNIFLTGCILAANFDFAGLLDYAIKAVVGGAIWLAYKAVADHLTDRRKRRSQNQQPNQ